MPALTWEQLDACQSVADLVALLEEHKVKGKPGKTYSCPLANATGWAVGNTKRWEIDSPSQIELTAVEQEFIYDFDDGKYTELAEKEELS